MVFERLFKGRRPEQPAAALYRATVDQARSVAFYAEYGVPDRFEERFDLLVLHVHLVVRRLTEAGQGAVAQALFDTLFLDMDATLRAMGVGDMSVGKRVKDMIRAYYGRTTAYDAALAEGDGPALSAALARNVLGAAGGDAERLARYVRVAIVTLGEQEPAALAAGCVRFPEPGGVA